MKARPFVMMNMAMSADGKVSSRSREPTTFTSTEDKRLLMKLRARCDAIITAASTVTIERATMRVIPPDLRAQRVRKNLPPDPIRVIVSGRLTLSPHLPVFKKGDSPIIIACCTHAPAARRKRLSSLARVIPCGRKGVNIPKLLKILARDYKVKTVLCEGGPTLNDAFFQAACVDELNITLCPCVVGGRNTPTLVDGKGFKHLAHTPQGRLASCRKGSREWFLKFRF